MLCCQLAHLTRTYNQRTQASMLPRRSFALLTATLETETGLLEMSVRLRTSAHSEMHGASHALFLSTVVVFKGKFKCFFKLSCNLCLANNQAI